MNGIRKITAASDFFDRLKAGAETTPAFLYDQFPIRLIIGSVPRWSRTIA